MITTFIIILPGVQSVPLTIYGDNSTVTISLEAITGLQEGQQYAIELCCIDEVISDVQDVCIHTQLLLILPDNISSSNSIGPSSKQLSISTVHTVSTILPTSILTGVMSSNVHSSPATTISASTDTMTATISAIASSNTAVTSTTISAIASSNTAITSTPVSSVMEDTSSTDTTAIMSDITTTVSSYVILTTSLKGSSTTTLASSSASTSSEPLSTNSLETITSFSHSSIVHQLSSEPLSTNSLLTITSSSHSTIVTLSSASSSPLTALSTSLSLTAVSRRNEESSITTVTASSMSNEASVTTQSTSLALPPIVDSSIHPKSTDPLQRTQSESETTPSSPSQIVTTSPSINLTINLGAIMTNIGDGSILTQNIVLISIGVSFLVFILIALVVCLMFGLFCYKKGSKTNALLEITPINTSIQLVTLPQKITEETNFHDTLPITNESFNTYTVIGARDSPSSLADDHPQLGPVNPVAVVTEHNGNNRSEASINAAVSREEEQRENGCTGDSHSITSSLNEQDVESDVDSIH